MLKAKFTVDYSIFENKMGALGTKVIPYCRIQAQQVAKYGARAVRVFTLRGKGAASRTPGRKKIAGLWRLTHDRKAYQDLYTIFNLYPNEDVIVFFEGGTKQHSFGPKTKKFLKFQDPETGEDVFTKRVDNPGMEGTHMLERARKEVIYPKMALWRRLTLAMVAREMR